MVASMGPEPNGSGKPTDAQKKAFEEYKLQWGRSRMAPENFPSCATKYLARMGFNGAGAEWLRKTLYSARLPQAENSFNGAGAEWLRKTTCRGWCPMILTDGFNGAGAEWLRKTFPAPRRCLWPTRFNGAGAEWLRKTPRRTPPGAPRHRFNGAGAEWLRKTNNRCFNIPRI